MSRFRNEIGVGVLLLAALAALLYMSFRVGALKSLGDTITVDAVFEDAAGLVEDGDVRLAGVRVGGVRSLKVEDGRCLATLVLRREAGARRDVAAHVRARSVLGEKYIALIPQGDTAPLLDDGDRIVHTAIPFEIDQMVTALGPLLEQVDPDDVAAIAAAMADLAELAGGSELDAEGLLAEAEKLLHNLNLAAEIAPQVREDVPVILRNVRAASEQLPATLERLNATMTRLDTLLADVETLTGRLGESTAELPETMADARVIAAELRTVAETLGRSDDELAAMIEDLAVVLDNLSAFDEPTLRRMLQDEGVRVRLKRLKADE